MSKSQAKNAFPQFETFMKESADFGSKYTEACTKSGAIFMKGFEDIMGTVISVAQDSAEKQVKFVKEAMAVKTINELTDVQNKIAKENFDDFVKNATKISEISVKVLTDSAEPVNAQITDVIQKATATAAATSKAA